MNIKRYITILVISTIAVAASAQIQLPSVLADNMVLQQQSEVKLWGKATPSSKISVKSSWDNKSISTNVAPDSSWCITVSTPKAGGPYTIDFQNGKHKCTLKNILIGEVWFCSGQSNMEMTLRGGIGQPVKGAADAILMAKRSTHIRMFITDFNKEGDHIWHYSKTPESNIQGSWYENEPENVYITSAIAYYFAQYLEETLDIPIGIIISSLGSSRIEAWMPESTIAKDFPDIDLSFLHNNKPIESKYESPTVLWNGKIHPLTNYTVKGFLWYQGEANIGNAHEYAKMMQSLAKSLRSGFGGGEKMPFLYVEIAPYKYEGRDKISSSYLREAQADALNLIPNSGMASTIDIGDPVVIHPADKESVAKRLAWMALTDTYGVKVIDPHSPKYVSHTIENNKIIVETDSPRGLSPQSTILKGFEIAGEDGVWYEASAKVKLGTNQLEVWSDNVPKPINARYAFRNCPQVSVFNNYGLPLLPFRTDR